MANEMGVVMLHPSCVIDRQDDGGIPRCEHGGVVMSPAEFIAKMAMAAGHIHSGEMSMESNGDLAGKPMAPFGEEAVWGGDDSVIHFPAGEAARIEQPEDDWYLKVNGESMPTDEARRIMGQHLPKFIKHFLIKNRQYRLAQALDLGPEGIIPDINRKTSALIARVWDGDEAGEGAESTVRIAEDLIGHLLLLIDKMTVPDDPR